MNEARSTFKTEIQRLKGELLQARDEIRLKMHLASMDAKDAWAELEPKIDEMEATIEAKAEEAVGEIGTELSKAAKDLQAQLKKLEDRLR